MTTAPVTVLVATTAIPAHTLNATLPVRGLAQRGARVLWCVPDGYQDHARRHGATVVAPLPAGATRLAVPAGDGALSGLAAVRGLYRDGLAGPVEQQVEHLLDLVERHRVDVLLSDTLMFAAGIVAEVAGIRWASFGDGPLATPDPQVPPLGTGLPPMAGPAGRHRNRTVRRVADRAVFAPGLAVLNRARQRHGLWPLPDLVSAGTSPQLHLQGCAPGFEFARRWQPPGLRYVGALGPGGGYGAPLPDELRRRAGEPPLALVTQGTLRPRASELVDAACEGLVRHGFRVLVAGSARPGRPHPRVGWMARVDLAEALRHADLLVTNGGYTTVTLALAAGVGVVQCGATEEKPDVGARIQHAGVGRAIRCTCPPARLVGQVAHQVWRSPPRRQASAELRREFQALDAERLAAEAIEQLAGQRGVR